MLNYIIIIGLVYCIGVATFFLGTYFQKCKLTATEKPTKKIITNVDIVTTRNYNQLPSTPSTTTAVSDQEPKVSAPINVDESTKQDEVLAKKKDAQIPNEKLDSVFSEEKVFSEPFEVEDEEEDEDIPLENEDTNISNHGASGTDYNSLNIATKILNNSNVAENEKKIAGETFAKIEGTSIFHQIINGDENKRNAIASLINSHFEKNQKEQSNSNKLVANTHNKFEQFDITDFIPNII